MVVLVIVMIVIVLFPGFKHRIEAMEAQTLIESELDQLGFKLRQMRERVDLAQHSADAAARGFARHGERVGEQRVVAQLVVGLLAIEKLRDFVGVAWSAGNIRRRAGPGAECARSVSSKMRREILGVRLHSDRHMASSAFTRAVAAHFVQRFDALAHLVAIGDAVETDGRSAALIDGLRGSFRTAIIASRIAVFGGVSASDSQARPRTVGIRIGLRPIEQRGARFGLSSALKKLWAAPARTSRSGRPEQLEPLGFGKYIERRQLVLGILGENVERLRLVLRFGRVELFEGVLNLAAQLRRPLPEFRPASFRAPAAPRDRRTVPAECAVGGVVFQPVEQHREHARIAHAQAGQQEGDIGALLLAQFLVEREQRIDGSFAERKSASTSSSETSSGVRRMASR